MAAKLLLLLSVLLAVPSACAEQGVTVDQLNGVIVSSQKMKDAKLAGRLYSLQLTQRLTDKKLAELEAEAPGPESRQALVALADQAEFLDLSPAEIPTQPAPSVDQQRAIIAKSVSYAEATLNRLPNLFARRDTTHFEDSPPVMQDSGNSQSGNLSTYQPLHPVAHSAETVLYRKGKEVVQAGAEKQGESTQTPIGMITYGEFGPIFSVLYGDLPKGNLRWSHWEQGTAGLDAVFRFDVPKTDSHYLVRYCCISGRVFQEFPAYHGELTIDPSNGTILRVTLIADLKGDPLTKSELMVKYGTVELGGKKYFCPVRSISVSRAPVQGKQRVGGGIYFNAEITANIQGRAGGPEVEGALQTMVNETTFDQYHLFRGDVKVLTNGATKNGSSENAPTDATKTPSHPDE